MLVNGKYSPDDVVLPSSDNGNGRVDANGDALVLDDFLAVYHMPGDIDDFEPAVPTNGTLGRYPETFPDDQKAGKYIINGPLMGTSKLDSAGFTDTVFLYFNQPITGDFKMRARIRITANAGASTSKGYHFGMYNAEEAVDYDGNAYVKFGAGTRGAGMLFRTNDTADFSSPSPGVRPYHRTKSGAWGTGSNMSSGNPDWMNVRLGSWKSEVILEMKRDAEGVTLTVRNSKTGALYSPAPTATSSISTVLVKNDDLEDVIRYGEKLYAGLALLGTSVEFSEFCVWLGPEDDPDGNPQSLDNPSNPPTYRMPNTHPAYVPVDGVKIGISPAGNNTVTTPAAHASRPSTGVYSTTLAGLSTLQLVPVFEPIWADNTTVEWKVISWSGSALSDPNSMIVPVAGSNRVKLNPPGAGTAVILMNSRDPDLPPLSVLETLADWSLELTVN